MKTLGVATYLALLLGVSASHAQAEPSAKFELKGSEHTTLEECMEALEHGAVVPALTDTFDSGGGSFVVIYDGYMFTFYMKPETLSLCRKLTPTKID
jgi:hypothetical protein